MSVPTDSVLKRHYEQMSQAGSSSAADSGGSAPAEASSQGGLVGWLKKLFCG